MDPTLLQLGTPTKPSPRVIVSSIAIQFLLQFVNRSQSHSGLLEMYKSVLSRAALPPPPARRSSNCDSWRDIHDVNEDRLGLYLDHRCVSWEL